MGQKPDYKGAIEFALWNNKTKEGKPYVTLQIGGKAGLRIDCFPDSDEQPFVREYDARGR